MKKIINFFVLSQIVIFLTYFISFKFFINFEVAFLSSYFIMIGSMYAYKKMVKTQVKLDNVEEKRDLLDEIEDPHELYEDTPINETPAEELDLKAIVKEEKKKIKLVNLRDARKNARAGFSVFRLVPYVFLVLGFIALSNNELLNIAVYLPSLAIGIAVASISAKDALI